MVNTVPPRPETQADLEHGASTMTYENIKTEGNNRTKHVKLQATVSYFDIIYVQICIHFCYFRYFAIFRLQVGIMLESKQTSSQEITGFHRQDLH